MLNKIIVSAAFLAAATFALPASAAPEYVIDDDDTVNSTQDDTRVYGWTSERPLDCGAYHYWDGEECVDARAVPPDIGPKEQ
jgi:hypothetical protein